MGFGVLFNNKTHPHTAGKPQTFCLCKKYILNQIINIDGYDIHVLYKQTDVYI